MELVDLDSRLVLEGLLVVVYDIDLVFVVLE